MIVIVGAIRVAVIAEMLPGVWMNVPDRATSAVLVDGALDLIGGSSKATRRVAVQCRFCEASRQALVCHHAFDYRDLYYRSI